jgi:malate dehydrogenase (oxaloacetate-decarboxylating)
MIDAGLSQREARTRFYAIDRDGLLVEGMKGILDFQEPFVQKAGAVAG